MVEEAFRPGVVVTEVARRLGVHESLLYRWRGLMQASRTAMAEPSSFVAVTITPEPTVTEPPVAESSGPLPLPAAPATSPAILEVILPSGARLRVGQSSVDDYTINWVTFQLMLTPVPHR
nr:transposase [Azospirillum brasilense]